MKRFNRTEVENKERQTVYGEVLTPINTIKKMVAEVELFEGMQICEPCVGEGHFITTRYDVETGAECERVGILDRLLQAGIDNFKIYCYDVQEDNLEITKANILATLKDYNKECLYSRNFIIDKKDSRTLSVAFDVVITNPPYQLPLESHGKHANVQFKPVYHTFMEWAYKYANHTIMITPARFLAKIGNGVDKKWIDSLLNDTHFNVVEYIGNEQFFKNTSIRGGLAIHQYNKLKEFEPVRLFVANPIIKSIAFKARKYCDSFMNEIIVSGGQYITNEFDKLDEVDGEGTIVVFASKGKRIYKKAGEGIQKDERYKLLITNKYSSKRNGCGKTMIVGLNYEYSKSFNAIYFDTYEEARRMEAYIQSNVATVLLQTLKMTAGQHASVWYYVPQPQEIRKLFRHLSTEERNFIVNYTNRWEV